MSIENNRSNPFGYDTRNVETPGYSSPHAKDAKRYLEPGHQLPMSPEAREQISKDKDIREILPSIAHINREILNIIQRVTKLEKTEDNSGRLNYLEKENQRLQYERDAYHAKVLALVDYIAGNRDE